MRALYDNKIISIKDIIGIITIIGNLEMQNFYWTYHVTTYDY